MRNDPSAPSAPPSKGFASILSLVSDVSQDLAALEQADATPTPPTPTPRPQPERIAPTPTTAGPYVSVAPPLDQRPMGPYQTVAPRGGPVASRVAARQQQPGMSRTTKEGIFWLAVMIMGGLALGICGVREEPRKPRVEQPSRWIPGPSQEADRPPTLRQWGQH